MGQLGTSLFDESLALLDDYARSENVRKIGAVNPWLLAEFSKRLRQLKFIVDRVRELEPHATAVFNLARANGQGPEAARFSEVFQETLTEIELLTESFYYIAHRARVIARHSEKPLPGLDKFECKAARDTRNHLLEHPEGGSSRVFTPSFGWGEPGGPRLKPVRPSHEEKRFEDAGLYVAAREFNANLSTLLARAIGTDCTDPAR